MQYYIYNNNDSQNEYQKVYVDGILAKDRQITIGKLLFEIFTTFSKLPPLGALPLNGYTIYNCDKKLPLFWDECVRRKKEGTIPVVDSLHTWKHRFRQQNGNVGAFWIDETDKTVKLPCLDTVVLTNNIDLNNSNKLFGSYIEDENKIHNHIISAKVPSSQVNITDPGHSHRY